MIKDLVNKKILITGGTGFIGGRLLERLVVQYKADVRVLVRNFSRICRIARFPIDTVFGDVTSQKDVFRALEGCEYVFHCAYGNTPDENLQRKINVDGTRYVMEAAYRQNIKRVIHLSTIMVYGKVKDGDLDETHPWSYSGNVYADTKIEAEKIAFDFADKMHLPVVVLQPAAVYGPFAPVWTTNVLNKLKRGRFILINQGSGLSNAVFVDDVVNAMILSAIKDEAVGESFIISGDDEVTWRDFYKGFQSMLGDECLVDMSVQDALRFYKKAKLKRASLPFRRLARSILAPEIIEKLKDRYKKTNLKKQSVKSEKKVKSILPLSPSEIKFYAAKTKMRIDKAKKMISYQPVFNFKEGLKTTEDWARWANLIE